ncbi:MAG TPA: gamma-glutamyl-gamma-aminobutyrate hydrolase family protein [Candidatus Binatia bacterium]|nr:gamma-glutamyl-gamma-aminobutyrate hydrolase family protein [Candidatus Binatia bacterium]
MAKPLIGITPNIRDTKNRGTEHVVLSQYVAMIAEAGAIPLIVPAVSTAAEAREVLARLDGLLMTGGKDIEAERYGQETRDRERLAHADRVASDFAYAAATLELERPTLGVCLGTQVMNVAGRGTLHQHLPEDLPGAAEHEDDDEGGSPDHDVVIEPGSRLRELLGVARARVNSYHHQAIASVAPGWRVGARAVDGVIEAIEREDRPFYLGVQWHPERMRGSEVTRRLAAALVDAARGAPARSSRTSSGSP